MKVGTRLAFGYGVVILLLIAVAITGVLRMAQIQGRLESIVNVTAAKTAQAKNMRLALYARMVSLRDLGLLTAESELMAETRNMLTHQEAYAKAEKALAELMENHASDKEKELLAKIKEQEGSAGLLIAKATALALDNKSAELTQVLNKELAPVQRKWMDAFQAFIELEEAQSLQTLHQAEAEYVSARLWMIGLAALAALVAAVAGVLLTRGLVRQLGGEPGDAMQVAERIAKGDLTVDVRLAKNDRGSMMASMKSMRENLAALVLQVRQGTDSIAAASAQIASGNLDLSARTEQQAGSLEETASSMEELTSTVKQNADNARQANQLAVTASEVAEQGGAVVSQVVQTMGAINESARKISDIIGVIDGIAFQTNILALNAAVEAARAGEQGRGFAVVATEVRSLAQRSAAAAKEIKTLIGDSVDKVGEGSQLVDKAGTTMSEVVSAIRRVTDIMGEITAASAEQSAGIDQVNQAVAQMDQVTQQNAALVEQAAASSASMQEQARALATLVGTFKVDARGGESATPAASAKPAPVQPAATPVPARKAPVAAPVPAPVQTAQPLPKAAAKPAGKLVAAGDDDWEEF